MFESFCSTAQHVFDTSRDTCTVTLTAREPQSHCWAVWVVLHREYDPTLLLHWDRVALALGTPELEAWQSPQLY